MQRRRGVSLAKGPIALIGLLGIIYGVTALIAGAHGFALHFPSGHVHGRIWLHLQVNGWTALLFIAAGLALLFSAAAHVTAKSMAMLVGVVMIVLAVIGFFQKHGTLGIFASDHWTELVWCAGGVALLLLAMMPRIGGGPVRTAPVPGGTTAAPATTAPATTTTTTTSASGPVAEERVVRHEPAATDRPLTGGDEPLVRRTQPVPDRERQE